MRVNLPTLKRILLKNVAEIKFTRRRPQPGQPLTRRMLCTNDSQFLNSAKGRIALNFRPPRGVPKYNPDERNLVITWDIFMQDYRTINADQCEMISIIPANDKFWEYFSDKLSKMTPDEKISFMRI